MWLLIPVVLVALAVMHELVVFGLARVLGAQAKRYKVYARLSGHKRGALAFIGAIAAVYVAICALAFTYAVTFGLPYGPELYFVGEVKAGMPADGKLEIDDRIVEVDHTRVYGQQSLIQRINANNGAPVTLSILRAGKPLDVTIAPTHNKDIWVVGIVPRIDRERDASAGVALHAAAHYPTRAVAELVRESGLFARETADPGGPKRIYEEVSTIERSTEVQWRQMLRLTVIVGLLLLALDLVRAGRLVVLGSAA